MQASTTRTQSPSATDDAPTDLSDATGGGGCGCTRYSPGLVVPCDYALPARTLQLLAELVIAARAAKGATTEAA